MRSLIHQERIENKILLLRGQKVMFDRDLAELYGVEVKHLKRQVRRNIARFPGDFMFVLTKEEFGFLRSHFGALKRGEHSKYLPYAFTEHGILMLSSVLNSKRAIHVNIQIMRVFVKLREIISFHKDLAYKLAQLESKYEKHDKQIHIIFEQIRQFLTFKEKPKKRIGFTANTDLRISKRTKLC